MGVEIVEVVRGEDMRNVANDELVGLVLSLAGPLSSVMRDGEYGVNFARIAYDTLHLGPRPMMIM